MFVITTMLTSYLKTILLPQQLLQLKYQLQIVHHLIHVSAMDDAEDLGVQNLIDYSSNYSETTRSLCIYSKDEATYFINNIANTVDLNSFKYKAKLLGNTEAQANPNQANGVLKEWKNCCPIKMFE